MSDYMVCQATDQTKSGKEGEMTGGSTATFVPVVMMEDGESLDDFGTAFQNFRKRIKDAPFDEAAWTRFIHTCWIGGTFRVGDETFKFRLSFHEAVSFARQIGLLDDKGEYRESWEPRPEDAFRAAMAAFAFHVKQISADADRPLYGIPIPSGNVPANQR